MSKWERRWRRIGIPTFAERTLDDLPNDRGRERGLVGRDPVVGPTDHEIDEEHATCAFAIGFDRDAHRGLAYALGVRRLASDVPTIGVVADANASGSSPWEGHGTLHLRPGRFSAGEWLLCHVRPSRGPQRTASLPYRAVGLAARDIHSRRALLDFRQEAILLPAFRWPFGP